MRLKWITVLVMTFLGFSFNSILVRLKYGLNYEISTALTSFQFHIGAIKIKKPNPAGIGSSKFQFHIGAIKMIMGVSDDAGGTVFQFHIGAIKIRCIH